MEQRDSDYIQDLAVRQERAGADFIDINAGAFVEDEAGTLEWAMTEVQAVTAKPISIDSPSGEAIKRGLALHKNGKPFINSITRETERWKQLFPLVVENDTYVLGLCIDDKGISDKPEVRARIAERIINDLVKAGKKTEDIAIDPLTTPIGVDWNYGLFVLDTIRIIKQNFPETKLITGLSNVSYGLPARKQINRAFMIACMAHGLDGALINPLDQTMMSLITTTEAVLGKDPYCTNYIKAFREGLIVKE